MDKATEEVLKLIAMPEDERERYFAALPPDKTSTLLIEDLHKKPQSEVRDTIIKLAKSFWYDDFKTLNPSACPKVTLYDDLNRAGFHDLAHNVVQGRYD